MTTLRISKYGIGGNRCSKESTDKQGAPGPHCLPEQLSLEKNYHYTQTLSRKNKFQWHTNTKNRFPLYYCHPLQSTDGYSKKWSLLVCQWIIWELFPFGEKCGPLLYANFDPIVLFAKVVKVFCYDFSSDKGTTLHWCCVPFLFEIDTIVVNICNSPLSSLADI